MSGDPKAKHVRVSEWAGSEKRRRVLTIHDGARLTPALVAMLAALAEEVDSHVGTRLDPEGRAIAESAGAGNRAVVSHRMTCDRARLTPVLVARADGLAIYADPDGEVL